MASATATISTNINATASVSYTAALAADANYRNSDASFTQAIAPGATYTAPNVTFTDNVGLASTVPANVDFAASMLPIAYVQLTYPENTTVYTVGDVGTQLANGTYDRTTVGVRPILLDNDTLHASTLNAFGNNLVWTDELGTQIYANNYAINHYLGIGVYLVLQSTANWATSVTASQTSTAYIYSDWRLPNGSEMYFFIRDDGVNTILNYSPMSAFISQVRFWTCESGYNNNPSNQALHLNTTLGISPLNKGTGLAVYSFLIRNHY